MLSKELESILQVIYADARMQRYEFIGIEHLLLSLVQESDEVRAVLKSCKHSGFGRTAGHQY